MPQTGQWPSEPGGDCSQVVIGYDPSAHGYGTDSPSHEPQRIADPLMADSLIRLYDLEIVCRL